MKICSKCKTEKPLEFFGKDKRSRDGLRSQCKDCEKIYNSRYEENHRAERNRLRRDLAKKYRETHKDIESNRLKRWAKNNPEKIKASRKASKFSNRCKNPIMDTDISLNRLFLRDQGECKLCGGLCNYDDYEIRDGVFIAGNDYPSIDHIKPLSKGGSHTWDNIQLAHRRCNSIKHNREEISNHA